MKSACVGVLSIIELKNAGETLKFLYVVLTLISSNHNFLPKHCYDKHLQT